MIFYFKKSDSVYHSEGRHSLDTGGKRRTVCKTQILRGFHFGKDSIIGQFDVFLYKFLTPLTQEYHGLKIIEINNNTQKTSYYYSLEKL